VPTLPDRAVQVLQVATILTLAPLVSGIIRGLRRSSSGALLVVRDEQR
jgi:hypothetical protein